MSQWKKERNKDGEWKKERKEGNRAWQREIEIERARMKDRETDRIKQHKKTNIQTYWTEDKRNRKLDKHKLSW